MDRPRGRASCPFAGPKELQDTPTSVGDATAQAAVGLTNAIFGKDEDPGTGTRRGEVGAGIMGMLTSPALVVADHLLGGRVGGEVSEAAGDFFDIDPRARTSGATPRTAARTGQWLHDFVDPPRLAEDAEPSYEVRNPFEGLY
jgi:hypothetical protein